jgi:primosomal protein N' (replication factor Y)
VARVAVDSQLVHLDRPFDYLVPESLAALALPGARVRVRLAGQDLAGFVLARAADSAHGGELVRIRSVVSPEPVLDLEVGRLARRVADRYAGTLADVLRLAVPPRVAAVEREPMASPLPRPAVPEAGPWTRYPGGEVFLRRLAAGDRPRTVWTALPGEEWPAALAVATATALSAGRGALVVVPDRRDVDRVDAALTMVLGPGRHVALIAELGPTERYRRWLAVRRGAVRAVVGTRSTMFAPVRDLGLVAVWDDGDDLHAEPRAPYPHVREVLLLRAGLVDAAALVGGFARTAEGEALLRSGWARPLQAPRDVVRRCSPWVRAGGDDAAQARDPLAAAARLPTVAWRTARQALDRGPILIQVPRGGYLPAVGCRGCRTPARCGCGGPLAIAAAQAPPACRWCASGAGDWRCPRCGGAGLRAVAVGCRRTADELGRAFPGIPVRTSGRDGVLAAVEASPALVVATPGAEPVAAGGYAAALLLDGGALLARPDLRAAEEALRRWLTAAALVRPAAEGGAVVVLADPAAPAVQALLRWDPATFAARELDDRRAVRFPPASRVAEISGSQPAVTAFLALAEWPAGAQVLGPVPGEDDGDCRAVVRVPLARGDGLAATLQAARAAGSARKIPDPVRVRIDPVRL